MSIHNVPEKYVKSTEELVIFELKMNDPVANEKVNLTSHMFSFLQEGSKEIHFSETKVAVHKHQSVLAKKGNTLWTEWLDGSEQYGCKLLFFTDQKLLDFLEKHAIKPPAELPTEPYYVFVSDDFIHNFLDSLHLLFMGDGSENQAMLQAKFDELMLYLVAQYGESFEHYLYALVSPQKSPFQTIIESKIHSNLKLEEIAFLCHMSLSTFKRNFVKEYGCPPGKWLQNMRLNLAKDLMQKQGRKASEFYFELGYSTLSNFSTAFKKKFGYSPKDVKE